MTSIVSKVSTLNKVTSDVSRLLTPDIDCPKLHILGISIFDARIRGVDFWYRDQVGSAVSILELAGGHWRWPGGTLESPSAGSLIGKLGPAVP